MEPRCVIPSAIPYTLSSEYSCLPGLYCPFLKPGDNTTLPAMCPPTITCSIKRLTGGWCSPQGTNEPQICPRGSFCPSPTMLQVCPSGSWCPSGSSKPIECEWFSSCPEGSTFRTHWGLLLLCALVDALVLSLSFWNFQLLAKLKGSSSRQATCSFAENEDISCPLLSHRASSLPSSSGILGKKGAVPEVGHVLALGFSRMNRTGCIELRVTDLSVQLPGGSSYTSYFSGKAAPCAFWNTIPVPMNSKPRNIISLVSAIFSPGRLHAIMGPSGSGKTTLLNCIAGKLDASSGSIFLNSTPVNPRSVKKCFGFVPQDDVMLRTLTVQEIVQHRLCASDASFRFPRTHTFPVHAFVWAPPSQKAKNWLMRMQSYLHLDWIRFAIRLWVTNCHVAFRVASGSDLILVLNWPPLLWCFFWMNRRVGLIQAQL
jgi:hypothetical protein